jgi:hypothetical protein
VDQWADSLDPRTVARCRKRHSTAIALEEMRSPNTLVHGIVRLATEGSVTSQLKRPFMFVFHILRRNILSPYWRASGDPRIGTDTTHSGTARKGRALL